jgi:hypothetical protein
MKRIDSLQYYLSKKKISPFEDHTKKTDFCFAYTVIEKSRTDYIDDINNLQREFETSELFVYNKLSGENTSIPKDVYLTKIRHANYTMIVPSYDTRIFSFTRFIEAINNDCLPLIQKDVYIDDVEKSFQIDLKQLKVTQPFSENDRLELLNYYKNTMLKIERNFVI